MSDTIARLIRSVVTLASSAVIMGVVFGFIPSEVVTLIAALLVGVVYAAPLVTVTKKKPEVLEADYPLIELMEHEELGVTIELLDNGAWKELPLKRTVGDWGHSDTCPTCKRTREAEKVAAEYATRSRQDKQMLDMWKRRAEREEHGRLTREDVLNIGVEERFRRKDPIIPAGFEHWTEEEKNRYYQYGVRPKINAGSITAGRIHATEVNLFPKEPSHDSGKAECDCIDCLSAWFVTAAHMATRGRNGNIVLATADALRLKNYDRETQRHMIKALTELFAELHPTPQVEEALRRAYGDGAVKVYSDQSSKPVATFCKCGTRVNADFVNADHHNCANWKIRSVP